MKIGDYVDTPRFLKVEISAILTSDEARKQGFYEPTHYESDDYNIYGKSLGGYRMEFAAVKKCNV